MHASAPVDPHPSDWVISMRQESAIDYLPSLNAGRSGARPGHDSWVLFTVDTDTDWLSGDHGPWDMDTQKLKKKKESRLTQSLKAYADRVRVLQQVFWGWELTYDTSGSLYFVLWTTWRRSNWMYSCCLPRTRDDTSYLPTLTLLITVRSGHVCVVWTMEE